MKDLFGNANDDVGVNKTKKQIIMLQVRQII